MFGISGEHLLVLLVILLIFGPKRLPDLGNSLGRTLKNFKDAMAGNDQAQANTMRPAVPANNASAQITAAETAAAPQQSAQAPAEQHTQA